MRTDHSSRRPSRNVRTGKHRFSAVEVVVIGVIVLLLVMSIFPVRAMVRFQNEKKQAYDRARAIDFALRGYEEEYKKLPIDPTAIKDDFFETVSDEAFMAVLRGGEHPQNPLRTEFYIEPYPPDSGGDIRDPWGNLYSIRIDSDSDKAVALPEECARDVKKADKGRIRTKVIVWSKGRETDGQFEAADAWIKSWDRP